MLDRIVAISNNFVPGSTELGPNSANYDHCLSGIDRTRPGIDSSWSAFDRIGTEFGQIPPNSARHRQSWTVFGWFCTRLGPGSAKFGLI